MKHQTFYEYKPASHAWWRWLPTAAFYAFFVLVAVWVALASQEGRAEWSHSLLLGISFASLGCTGFVLLWWAVWSAFMYLAHGAPFHVGDVVEICRGEHKGQRAVVTKLSDTRYAVRVALASPENSEVDAQFDWSSIHKVR